MKSLQYDAIRDFAMEWRKQPDWLLRCFYCGIQLNNLPGHPQSKTREHLIPRSIGRAHGLIVRACFHCNQKRGAKPFDDFRRSQGQFYAERVLNQQVNYPSLRIKLNRELQIFSSRLGNIVAKFGRGEPVNAVPTNQK